MFTVLTIISGAVILTLNCVMCLDNGLARTPPMGWSTFMHSGVGWIVRGIQTTVSMRMQSNEQLINVSDGWRELGLNM
ncbi:uncharacterized protein DC041_0011069 [Schistosoma bovis]|uniref:Uncharacterized protein n=1 Tax=Schistosoma bovis TaxID=6184 RepID=A0A430QUG7_SCHBO|nr:uncharacterized protein DC041_0011069 [Schistosoma bovis]